MSTGDATKELPDRSATNLVLTVGLLDSLVVRRFEDIEFVDHATICRSTRLYLDLEALPMVAAGVHPDAVKYRGYLPIPLTTIERTQHRSHDVRAADGSLVPTLPKKEERALVLEGILHCLELVGGTEVSDSTRKVVTDLITADAQSRENVEAALDAVGDPVLSQNASIRRILVTCATRYLLVALVPPEVKRPVLSITHNAPISHAPPPARGSRLSRFRERVQRTGTVALQWDVSSASQVGSFHADIAAPYDMTFSAAWLECDVQAGASWERHYSVDIERVENRAHLHLARPFTSRDAVIKCVMQHRPTGLIRASGFSALLTLLVLLTGLAAIAFTDFPEQSDSQSAAALLLLAPAFVGTLLATPTSHSMTATALFPTRATLALVSFMPLLAVTTLVIPWNPDWSWIPWLAAAGMATIGTSLLFSQWRRLCEPTTTLRSQDLASRNRY